MQKEIYVKDLKEHINKELDLVMFVYDLETKTYSTKDSNYIHLLLGDKTGSINAFLWDYMKLNIKPGDIIKLKAKVKSTKEFGLQLIVNKDYEIKKIDMDYSEFLQTTPLDVDKMLSFLIETVEAIKDNSLREIAGRFYRNKEYLERFKKVPMTLFYNHNYIGGLLEYTFFLTKLALQFEYIKVNKDLLITGSLLYKMGKIFEYENEPLYELGEEGLLSYRINNYKLIEELSKGVNIEKSLKNKLIHILTNTKPMFIEAMILAQLDYSISNISSFIINYNSLKEDKKWVLDKRKNSFLYYG